MTGVTDELWATTRGELPILATAIHDGHELRPSAAAMMQLSPADLLREEDPHTGRLTSVVDNSVIPRRSRFEVDLNRRPSEAVYESAADSWGLELWREPPSPDFIEESQAIHAAFYDHLELQLRDLEDRFGAFVVLDIHSYNHRREGPSGNPADPDANPDVNVGTGSVPREAWSDLIDGFIADLGSQTVQGRQLDVRENVKFRGRYLAEFVHTRFPETGCALALEFKKTFMDEWTGEVDEVHFAELSAALAATVPGLLERLETR